MKKLTTVYEAKEVYRVRGERGISLTIPLGVKREAIYVNLGHTVSRT